MTLLAYLSIAWAIGTWLGSRLALPLHVWLGAALAAFLATFLARPFKARLFLTCVAALALGATRLILAEPRVDEHSLANHNDQGKRTLVGVVADEPDVRDSFVFYKLDAENLLLPDSGEALAVKGAARVRGPRYPVYSYGDRLQVQGDLETPPVLEGFDYRDYLAHKGIHSQVSPAQIERLSGGAGSPWKRLMLSFKGRAQATIGRILPEPEASLLTGILLGNEGGIPSDLKEDFKATGASHVIAISGFNISIISALMMATLGRVLPDRRLAAGIAMLGVAVYTLLVGADAAVVRAAAMGIVTLLGLMANRTGVALNTLAIAALAMMVLNPSILEDVGFQLSVAATLGLILYAEPFERVTYRLLTHRFSSERAEQIVGWISEALLLTLAAQILTTPLILWHFGRLSVVSLLTNVLILPIQSLVMTFGGAATLVGLAFEPLGRVVGWVAYPWLTWTIRAVEWTARFPHASVPLELSDLGLLAVYALIGLLSILALLDLERRRALWQTLRTRLSLTAAMGGMALVTTVAWFAVLQFPDDKLHVTFLDVGQGDAIFIETPGGAQILVDGGPEGGTLLSELGRQMPFWDRTLDLVVLTHPDADHLTGLIAVLERYGVRAVVAGHAPHQTDLLRTWETALVTAGATPIQGQAGTRLELSDDITLDILHPVPNPGTAYEDETSAGTTNDNSVVVRLVYRDVAFLLPGDVEAEVEQQLVRSGAYLHSTVLKVPHHGSKTSSAQAFLEAVRPQVAVISVGADNDFGHPARDVLQRLRGTPHLYRTDRDGRVTVSSDGHKLWIETEH
jgi:competence protein ComEC